MKLLMVWHAGGIETYRERIKELSKKFDEIILLVPNKWNEGGKLVKSSDILLAENCKIVCGKTLFNFHASTYIFTTTLIKILKDFKPDIIHIHEEPWSLSAFQLFLYTKILKINSKLIIDSAAISLTKKPIFFSKIEKVMYKHTDIIFARNHEVSNIVKKRGYKKSIHILPNGVDTNNFKVMSDREILDAKQKEGIWKNKIIVSYIGRMVKEKGIFDFIEAAEELLKKDENKYGFIMVGSGPEFERVRTVLKGKGIDKYFILNTRVASDQMPKFMNLIDLLVLPSHSMPNWKEQFGRVLVEAMACGKPVLGSNSGAIPEVVGNKKYIFEQGNISQLVNKVEGIIADFSEFKEISIRNRLRVESKYSWYALSDYYYNVIYSELIQKNLRSEN
ncbi:glycosyltransferase [Halobacillus rhizosphaerae]|uniref:glycosyltransferase n=1 Tax=Halobacillus rhizosphaerae TaxID=3064889 RepID=UPI00398A85AA